MPFKLTLAAIVHCGETGEDALLRVGLLQQANAWLQRLASGTRDDLFLIGVGFEDEGAFRAMLEPYGLTGATMSVVTPDDAGRPDHGEWNERVADVVESWVNHNHPAAVPVVDWRRFCDSQAYAACDWWWVGVEATGDSDSGAAQALSELAPGAFTPQASTWAAILTMAMTLEIDVADYLGYESGMTIATLGRWLTGFDAAAENNFYYLDLSAVAQAAGIDLLRLGIEAGRNHASDLSDAFEDPDLDDSELAEACLRVCLENRTYPLRQALADAFGGDGALFWSLYRSIWPNYKKSSDDNMEDLLGLREASMGELDRPWQFVTEGWVDFSEE